MFHAAIQKSGLVFVKTRPVSQARTQTRCVYKPSASASLIMSCNSTSVGFRPSDLITSPNSFAVMVPSPSLSNKLNATFNSVPHSLHVKNALGLMPIMSKCYCKQCYCYLHKDKKLSYRSVEQSVSVVHSSYHIVIVGHFAFFGALRVSFSAENTYQRRYATKIAHTVSRVLSKEPPHSIVAERIPRDVVVWWFKYCRCLF